MHGLEGIRVLELGQEDEVLVYARRVAQVPVDLLTLHKAATNRFFEAKGQAANLPLFSWR